MSSCAIRNLAPQAALACAALLALTACERGARPAEPATELAWARTALERNPRIEVLASDTHSGVFTVRDRTTGQILAVKLNEIAAAPLSQLSRPDSPSAATSARNQVATPLASEPEQAASTAEPSPAEPSRTAGTHRASAPNSEAKQADGRSYTIDRSGGRLRVSGPGISIVSSTGDTATAAREPGQRAVDPIICEGHRMLHLDDRSIYVDGDAITARDGCELFITNSRIMASGTGIVVRDAAVHVSNSHITGADNSIDATDRARLYVRGSTFEGLPKRSELALVQDQGGNRWQ